jgi:hypothetical protein
LSEKTIVASVHVLIAKDKDYMEVANGIRKALHEHGVHSSTIQPEFGDEADDVSVSTFAFMRERSSIANEFLSSLRRTRVSLGVLPKLARPRPAALQLASSLTSTAILRMNNLHRRGRTWCRCTDICKWFHHYFLGQQYLLA